MSLTAEVKMYLRDLGFELFGTSPNATHCTVWFKSKSYVEYKVKGAIKSPKHQPLVPFKLFQQLMLLPTHEARTEFIKARVKRKWD